jgi:predicted S18 family serine protease
MVNMSARLIPGNSEIFLSTFPQTGTSTQESADDAAYYAIQKSGVKDCDIILKIDTAGSAGYVDGPSAGAAFAVLAYSALTGKEPRRDAVMSGTVDQFGNVGSVGGLYEKAMAAVASNSDYFLIPKSGYFELLLLRNIREGYPIEILEIGTADDAIGFMLDNKTIPEASFERTSEPLPELEQRSKTGLEEFDKVSQNILKIDSDTILSIPSTDNESAIMKTFYIEENAKHYQLLKKGYVFSAANEAFLNYIEASTISAVLSQKPDLAGKQANISTCLSTINQPNKTKENFEWVVGGDLRKEWALKRLNVTDITIPELQEEKYVAYNELMYADAWCLVSKSLYEVAGETNGTDTINESSWEPLAKQILGEAHKIKDTDQDITERINSAGDSYSKGNYGASIFDSVYALEMDDAIRSMGNMSTEQLNNEITSMLEENRTSLWGKIYQGHGAYLAAPNVSATGPAYKILRYSKALDEAVLQMQNATTTYDENGDMPGSSILTEPIPIILGFSVVLIMIIFLFFIINRKQSNGKYNQVRKNRR